jgi:hypothetical protein
VAVEVDAHARPVEARGDLFNVRRLAGAVIAGHDDAPVVGEAGEDRERRGAVETVILVDFRHVVVGLGIGRNLHVTVDAE